MRAGEGSFRGVNGRGLGGEDSVGRGIIEGLLYGSGVEVGEGQSEVGGQHDAICKKWGDGREET